MSRRLLISVLVVVLLWQTPALAGLVITDRQQAATELTAGPQFYAYGSGTDVRVGQATAWDGFELEGLEIDGEGALVLGRAGDVDPSEVPWHDPDSTTRSCEAEAGAGARALVIDLAGEVEAGRLRPDLADLRAHAVDDGAPVGFRTDPNAVVVDHDGAVCVYWGSDDAVSIADPTLTGPVVADGGWSWERWNDVGDGTSLDLVDWSDVSADGTIPTASVPADICNQCADEIVGFVTPEVSGSYQFFLSADNVGRLEIGPAAPVAETPAQPDPTTTSTAPTTTASTTTEPTSTGPTTTEPTTSSEPTAATTASTEPATTAPTSTAPTSTAPTSTGPTTTEPTASSEPTTSTTTPPPVFDPTSLQTIIELSSATPIDDFGDPAQASEPIDLVAGQSYAIRARSKDLEAADHLQIAWALDGAAPAVLSGNVIADVDGQAGQLTHRRFDVVATTDRSVPPDAVVRIEASHTDPDSCDVCAHEIAGWVVVADSGTHRFWISSDDEAELWISTTGDPADADRVAWLTNFTTPLNWTADPSQRSAPFELEAGQVLWVEAFSRDRGGPDHLQVGWTRDDGSGGADTPELIPSAQLSEAFPQEAPLPDVAMGPIEGQAAAAGSFRSAPIDTTSTGSGAFGLLLAELGAATDSAGVEMSVEFAADPAGPWTASAPVVDQRPAPLDADGLRWVRFTGSITEPGAGVVSLGLERDLIESPSIDATTTVTVPGAGVHAVLRVRGTVGVVATAELGLPSTAGVDIVLVGDGWPEPQTVVDVDGVASHHVAVVVGDGVGPAAGTSRWMATDGLGLTVVHDVVVVVEGA